MQAVHGRPPRRGRFLPAVMQYLPKRRPRKPPDALAGRSFHLFVAANAPCEGRRVALDGRPHHQGLRLRDHYRWTSILLAGAKQAHCCGHGAAAALVPRVAALHRHDSEKIWSTGAGRPRVALHPGVEREEHLGDDEVGAGVYHAPDNDPPEPGDVGEGALSLFAAMPASQRDEMHALGAELLQEAGAAMPWGSASHSGFRPMRSAGFPRAMQIWEHYMRMTSLSWRNQLSTPTFGRKFLVRVTQAHD